MSLLKIPDETANEIKKCNENPYYFATTYLTINGKPFTTPLKEEVFNNLFKQLSK